MSVNTSLNLPRRFAEDAIGQSLRFLAAMPWSLLVVLPISSCILMLPAMAPDEAVLSDDRPTHGFFRGLMMRAGALLIGASSLVALTLFAATAATGFQTASTTIGAGIFHLFAGLTWPQWLTFLMVLYLLDIVLLCFIGKVPLNYNVRNLMVRWKITLLTAVAFTVVVALMVVMLAFVNGMYQLTEESGQPANVLVIADGTTDELFSNFSYNDIAGVEVVRVTQDENDRPLERPLTVARTRLNGRETPLFSKETYIIVNQPTVAKPGRPSRRRFVQVRGIHDPEIAGRVHGLELYEGGRWFSPAGVQVVIDADGRERSRIEAVLGEGVARELGKDLDRESVGPGDVFTLGDREWVVVGLMKADGTTFGSEIWSKQSLVGPIFRKEATTTLVFRAGEETAAAARAMAHHLRNRFTPKVQALPETEYYSKLAETNKQFLYAIIVVTVVMAVGGVLGVMNTMFAAISQRTTDIGVLRILGFKKWQILVSFLLESVFIGLLGGLAGCAIGWFADGWTASSIVNSGQGGGGKSVALRLVVDAQLLATGLLVAVMMARTGGLIPAVSAMRLKILESLR